MRQETKVEILTELMRQLDQKVNIDAGVQYTNPATSYTSKDMATQEWQTFFRGHPQLIGLSGDLAKTGDYITCDDFGVPVLATRDASGQFRAFVNACRHRGVRVANETRGRSNRFMCPFHNWTYSNEGDLVGIPREKDFGKIDKTCMGLIELPAQEKYGQLWVHPKPDGHLDVDELLGDLTEEISEWQVGKLQYAGESVIQMDLNWKLANDTFGETYHFQRLHKNTLGQLYHGDALSYQTFDRNHRFVFASKGIDKLRQLPESEWDTEGTANVLYFLFPNIQFSVSKHSVSLIKIYPDAENPGRSLTRVGHYYSTEAIAASQAAENDVANKDNAYEYTEKRVGSLEASREIFTSTIEQEDYLMGETTQKSAESGLIQELIFGRNEPALHHYHNTFREALNLPPLKRVV